MEKYHAIIDHPHHVSAVHPRMSMHNRAAQFSPFASLRGYEDQITETARLTDRRVELSESEEEALGRKLAQIRCGDAVEMTWFVPDKQKAGGRYVTERVTVKQVESTGQRIILAGGRSIDMEQIIDVTFGK